MMRLPKMEHVAPRTLQEACGLLEEHGQNAEILAGGTDLIVACKLGNVKPALLVSLSGIAELKGIRLNEKGGIGIGAMTALKNVKDHPDIRQHYPAVAQAAGLVAATQLQYMGSLGGNLCLDTRCIYYNQSHSWRKTRDVCIKMGGDVCHVVAKGKSCYAVFSADTAPALMAHEAQVRLTSRQGERVIPVAALYSGDGKKPLTLKANEILTEIMLPPVRKNTKSIYLKYRVRSAIDFPLAGVAVAGTLSESGHFADGRIIINAVGSGPLECLAAEELINGRSLEAVLIGQAAEKAAGTAHPVANVIGAGPGYRRKMIGVLTRRALMSFTNVPD
ncbi:MAG: FAD binding domain-containing protein [Desulfobacterales bacterium]|nr:FAD binding domain-containing protein [Desulfobacterales bacterium]